MNEWDASSFVGREMKLWRSYKKPPWNASFWYGLYISVFVKVIYITKLPPQSNLRRFNKDRCHFRVVKCNIFSCEVLFPGFYYFFKFNVLMFWLTSLTFFETDAIFYKVCVQFLFLFISCCKGRDPCTRWHVVLL